MVLWHRDRNVFPRRQVTKDSGLQITRVCAAIRQLMRSFDSIGRTGKVSRSTNVESWGMAQEGHCHRLPVDDGVVLLKPMEAQHNLHRGVEFRDEELKLLSDGVSDQNFGATHLGDGPGGTLGTIKEKKGNWIGDRRNHGRVKLSGKRRIHENIRRPAIYQDVKDKSRKNRKRGLNNKRGARRGSETRLRQRKGGTRGAEKSGFCRKSAQECASLSRVV